LSQKCAYHGARHICWCFHVALNQCNFHPYQVKTENWKISGILIINVRLCEPVSKHEWIIKTWILGVPYAYMLWFWASYVVEYHGEIMLSDWLLKICVSLCARVTSSLFRKIDAFSKSPILQLKLKNEPLRITPVQQVATYLYSKFLLHLHEHHIQERWNLFSPISVSNFVPNLTFIFKEVWMHNSPNMKIILFCILVSKTFQLETHL